MPLNSTSCYDWTVVFFGGGEAAAVGMRIRFTDLRVVKTLSALAMVLVEEVYWCSTPGTEAFPKRQSAESFHRLCNLRIAPAVHVI